MSEFRGFVIKINTKTGQGKRGPWTAYSLKLEGEDGVEIKEWLSYGFTAPKFKEGDYVKLNAEKDDKGYLKIDVDSVKVAKNPPARAGKGGGGDAPQSGGSSRGNYSKGGVDWNSAVARSIELVDLLIKHDALTLSAAKGAGGIEKRRVEIEAMVDKYSVKLYNDVITLRLLETVADTKADTKPDGELPAEGDDPEAKNEKSEDDDDQF
jgi:hypothetical protein